MSLSDRYLRTLGGELPLATQEELNILEDVERFLCEKIFAYDTRKKIGAEHYYYGRLDASNSGDWTIVSKDKSVVLVNEYNGKKTELFDWAMSDTSMNLDIAILKTIIEGTKEEDFATRLKHNFRIAEEYDCWEKRPPELPFTAEGVDVVLLQGMMKAYYKNVYPCRKDCSEFIVTTMVPGRIEEILAAGVAEATICDGFLVKGKPQSTIFSKLARAAVTNILNDELGFEPTRQEAKKAIDAATELLEKKKQPAPSHD